MKLNIDVLKDFFLKIKEKFFVKDGYARTSSVVIFGLVPILFIIYLLMGPVIKVVKKDINAEPMFIISENLNLRSDKSQNAYVIGNYDYGTEVKVYNTFDNKWAEVAVGRKKGYMSLEYLVSPEMFYLIDGMFGNDLAQKMISKTIYKKAIANYYIQQGYTSDMPEEIKKELYGHKWKNKETWQIFAIEGKPKFNSVAFGDFNGDRKTDIAVVLTNKKSKKNKLVVLSVANNTGDSFGQTLFSMDLPESWYYIRTAPKGAKYIINGQPKNIPIDGILVGSNRDPSLKDPQELVLFDGKQFKIYKQ